MKKILAMLFLSLVMTVGMFAYPVKSSFSKITKFDDITYYWNLEATAPMEAPSSKDWDNWISEMKKNGNIYKWKRVIPLNEALKDHTGPIAEVLLARSYGCYNICAIYENDFYVSSAFYFVSESFIFISSFELTKQR